MIERKFKIPEEIIRWQRRIGVFAFLTTVGIIAGIITAVLIYLMVVIICLIK